MSTESTWEPALPKDEVSQLREVLGAKNDSDLARQLGIGRSAVSRWKERGIIPPKYRFLIARRGIDPVEAAVQFVVHTHVYGHADHHYWLRAALQIMPADYGVGLDPEQRALLLEYVLTRLMDAAVTATLEQLGKQRCEGEEDFRELIAVLATTYSDRVARVLSEGRPVETPQ